MRLYPRMRRISVVVVVCAAVSASASAQTLTVSAGSLRSYSTIHSLGVEWDVSGDVDHDASATLEYRVTGASTWKEALPLVRIDYNSSNMLAGSVLFLASDISYDVKIVLTDPDGGGQTRQLSIRTRPTPVALMTGRIFHVVPGAGGGNGSESAPFGGIAAAEAVAVPGDTFLLHAGSYGGRIRFRKPARRRATSSGKRLGTARCC